MLQDHLLPALRGVYTSSPQSPNTLNFASFPIVVCWLERSLVAKKCSELEQIITNLVVQIGCSFQVVHKLVIGDDTVQFPIANTKNIAEFGTRSPSAISMTTTTFLVTFALNLSILSQGGSRKVLPTRSLNSGKGLLDNGPSSCLDLMKTVGTSG